MPCADPTAIARFGPFGPPPPTPVAPIAALPPTCSASLLVSMTYRIGARERSAIFPRTCFASAAGGVWRPFSGGLLRQDNGIRLVSSAAGSFVAASA